MFKTWEKIVAEHTELNNMMEKYHQMNREYLKEWNSKRAPLMTEETALRKQLLTCTERERKGIESKIDAIVDELKPLDKMLNDLEQEEHKMTNAIENYMRDNFTEKELKKAKKHGWEI